MKKTLLIFALFLFLVACNKDSPDNKIIGGDTDDYGCFTSAGYAWNEDIGACIRDWELEGEQREAAKIAVTSQKSLVTIIGVDVANCLGCFTVHLQNNEDRSTFRIILSNWEVLNQMTPEECDAEGGRAVTTVDGISCEEGELNLGNIKGFLSPTICCKREMINETSALEIAMQSECLEAGSLTGEAFYNDNSKTWWFDIESDKEGCAPACVVYGDGIAEINWRCTGALT